MGVVGSIFKLYPPNFVKRFEIKIIVKLYSSNFAGVEFRKTGLKDFSPWAGAFGVSNIKALEG